MTRSRSYIATPPGATIKEQLNDRGMSQKEFAARMDMSEKHISRLINGEVQLTPETAVRLETVLGVPAGFWNQLEAIYREKLIKAEAENAMDADAELAKRIPYNEMAKLGWVPETGNARERVAHLRKYFELVSLSLLDNEQVTRFACGRLSITQKSDLVLMAWAQEAKIKARDQETAPINLRHLTEVIPDIRAMTVMKPEMSFSKIKKTLAECGIALMIMPDLKGLIPQGVSFTGGNKIVIVLTNRERESDQFWFSLFHELAHIMLGHIGKAGGTTEEDEKSADVWSENVLISPEEFSRFRKENDFSEQSILRFAREQGIAPAIVVGRMQREGMIKNSMYNHLKEHFDILLQA